MEKKQADKKENRPRANYVHVEVAEVNLDEEVLPEAKTVEEIKEKLMTAECFKDLNISDKLKQILGMNDFDRMTTIQKEAIPVILKEKNVVVKSETGSGKTLAYLVPIIEYLSKYSLETEKISRDKGTYCIIFSPTRELCIQIDHEL